jgi:hypothetical protein
MTEPATPKAIGELVAELTSMIAARMKVSDDIRTDEIRNFIRENAHVGDFKSLAITLMLLGEG